MSHKRRALTAWIVVLALVVSAFFVFDVSRADTYNLTIYANAYNSGYLNDSGIDISVGDYVQISASGSWDSAAGIWGPNGDGYPAGNNICGTCNHAQLIGRIGGGGYFAIGASLIFTAGSSGRLYLGMNDQAAWFFDNAGDLSVSVIHSGGGTPTPVYTPTTTPTPVGFIPPYGLCARLRERATFESMSGWTGTAGNPTGVPRYLQLDEGESATTSISLTTGKWYEIDLAYRSSTPISGQYFTAQIVGQNSAANVVNVGGTTGIQRFKTVASLYTPVGGGYTLTLARPTGPPIGLVIEYVCVRERASATVTPPTPGTEGVVPEQCRDCEGGSDVQGWLNWLICQIRRFFTCVIGEFLRQIVKFTVQGVMNAVAFIQWVLSVVSAAIQWVVDIVVRVAQFFGGSVSNQVTSASNGVQTAIGDPTNRISSGVRDLPTALANAFAQAGIGTRDALSDLHANNLVEMLITLPVIVIRLIGVYIRALADLITLTPLLFQALIGGFANAAEPVSASPTCSNPSDLLFMPCLGFYLLDNTIFQGPAFYLIPLVMGLLTVQTVVWAIAKIKEAFGK